MTPSEILQDLERVTKDDKWRVVVGQDVDKGTYIATFISTDRLKPRYIRKDGRTLKSAIAKALEEWADET